MRTLFRVLIAFLLLVAAGFAPGNPSPHWTDNYPHFGTKRPSPPVNAVAQREFHETAVGRVMIEAASLPDALDQLNEIVRSKTQKRFSYVVRYPVDEDGTTTADLSDFDIEHTRYDRRVVIAGYYTSLASIFDEMSAQAVAVWDFSAIKLTFTLSSEPSAPTHRKTTTIR